MRAFGELREEFLRASRGIGSLEQLEQLRIRFLGRKGKLTEIRKTTDLSELSPNERKSWGRSFNETKSLIERTISNLRTRLRSADTIPEAMTQEIDVTLPVENSSLGSLHPVTLVAMELEDIFIAMGFMILEGFEVETEYYNFEALNIPKDHPARDLQDTYWLNNDMVLRTHTSACQIRAMERFKPPFRAIFPGRCFRRETIDASHENTFYQLEGLMIDKAISVAHLIGVMKTLISQVFKTDAAIRLRPGYFPFVEPGFELDIRCLICHGQGCATCKQSGWVELLPCGLVHPNVLRFGGVDPSQWSGFAFGLGLTRLAMMKYGISDIRVLNSGDLRVMKQFPCKI